MITTPSADWQELRGRYGALVEQFGDGWAQGRGDLMAAVFAEDGVFIPGPFEAPIRGTRAIAEYWRDIPLEQAEVAFRYGEIYVAGPWFATEFRCTFRRRRSGERMDIRGSMFCETANDKIAEMRLYWFRAGVRDG